MLAKQEPAPLCIGWQIPSARNRSGCREIVVPIPAAGRNRGRVARSSNKYRYQCFIDGHECVSARNPSPSGRA